MGYFATRGVCTYSMGTIAHALGYILCWIFGKYLVSQQWCSEIAKNKIDTCYK